MKFLQAAAATALYIFLLLLTYYIHASYFAVNVVFYAAIFDAAIAAVLTGALLPFFGRLGGLERLLLVVIWLLGGYAFAISGPTVLDRSLSFYILEKLQQRGGGIKLSAMEEVFTSEYMREHRLVDVRLTEQMESGTIEIVEGCVLLTPRGDRLARISRMIRRDFLPKKRLLMGKYSDDLTDPFRNSDVMREYTCARPGQ